MIVSKLPPLSFHSRSSGNIGVLPLVFAAFMALMTGVLVYNSQKTNMDIRSRAGEAYPPTITATPTNSCQYSCTDPSACSYQGGTPTTGTCSGINICCKPGNTPTPTSTYPIKYTCSSNYQCTQSTTGIYDSYFTCQNECIPSPQPTRTPTPAGNCLRSGVFCNYPGGTCCSGYTCNTVCLPKPTPTPNNIPKYLLCPQQQDVYSCNQAGCAWYACSNKCFPGGTPNSVACTGIGTCEDKAGKCTPKDRTCTPPNDFGQIDCGAGYKCVTEKAVCSTPASPTITPTITPTLFPGQGACGNKAGRCVRSDLMCNSVSYGQLDCITGYKCIPETAICPTPTPLPKNILCKQQVDVNSCKAYEGCFWYSCNKCFTYGTPINVACPTPVPFGTCSSKSGKCAKSNLQCKPNTNYGILDCGYGHTCIPRAAVCLNPKLDILVLSSGYIGQSEFLIDGSRMVRDFVSTVPFNEYYNKGQLQIHLIYTQANLGCLITDKGKFFQSVICNPGAVWAEAIASGLPFNSVITIYRSADYGASAWPDSNIAQVTSNAVQTDDLVAQHEFGHSFAGLWDEYDYGNLYDGTSLGVNCDYPSPCNKWIGKVPNTGCYQACTFSDAFRSVSIGIMNDTSHDSFEYGPVSLPVIRQKIESVINSK